jgi:hypothetical protein
VAANAVPLIRTIALPVSSEDFHTIVGTTEGLDEAAKSRSRKAIA